MSSALLGRALKKQLGIPWIMHLSDPWVDNPYRNLTNRAAKRDAALEAGCFASADLIFMTSEGQAEHYRAKYPDRSSNIFVSPNVMSTNAGDPPDAEAISASRTDDTLRVVYSGSLYGNRSPDKLLAAISLVRSRAPEALRRLRVDIYGNAQDHALQMLEKASDVIRYHGPLNFSDAHSVQSGADVLLVIEPDGDHPLLKHFLPSKVMDYLSLRKPILAITPQCSETWRLCREGYGWAIQPSDTEGLAALLSDLADHGRSVRQAPIKEPPVRYRPETVVDDLIRRMEGLLTRTDWQR
jgi:glycosyltransferase involved in cell wall biosynthesis